MKAEEYEQFTTTERLVIDVLVKIDVRLSNIENYLKKLSE